ncbi:MAG: Smr/MutS family protein [Acidocella sp.]|nr:Smr/MutS family protein [Acidocella sp.]
MARASGLSPADLKLWAAYSQTLPKLMPGKQRLPIEPEPVTAPSPPPTPTAPTSRRPRPTGSPVSLDLTPVGLDKSTWKKFSTGKFRAAARLDLHGHTAAQAHRQVNDFVERAYAGRARCIEIITGKGEILSRELPHWLNAPDLRPMILAIAHPHAGNTGSVRVLLRRVR